MIEAEDLTLKIGKTPILRDVSFRLAAGEVLGLVGESGSGKSMTALSVMGLLPPAARLEGSVRLLGRELTGLRERQRARVRGAEIGMIFQEPMTALNPVQTIGDQVAETLVIHGAARRAEARARARDRLERVGLPAARVSPDRYPHELSGGQRQRVCIAMAIALRPKLLIADEPTTALDVTTQAQILDLLHELVREEAMGLLLITHDLAVVSGMADRVAVMKDGEIVEQGPARDVFRDRKHPYTQALFAASSHRPDRPPGQFKRPLLQVHGAVRSYGLPRPSAFAAPGSFRAVDGVTFAISTGESLGLVGESGCGKSTLSRAILGLDPLQEGTIKLDGAPVHPAMARADRAKMQVVFQDPYGSFDPRHRVARLVAEPFHLTGRPADADARVAEALEAVGLSAADGQKYPHEFSGGQRQRIAIARALITRPKLIVLDEAVSALDVRVRAQILDLLADLQARLGLAYLFVSHDLTVVRAITDRVMVMHRGRIVESGMTEEIFNNPAHPYTRRLLASAPRLAL